MSWQADWRAHRVFEPEYGYELKAISSRDIDEFVVSCGAQIVLVFYARLKVLDQYSPPVQRPQGLYSARILWTVSAYRLVGESYRGDPRTLIEGALTAYEVRNGSASFPSGILAHADVEVRFSDEK